MFLHLGMLAHILLKKQKWKMKVDEIAADSRLTELRNSKISAHIESSR